jgi:hypothetical protein
MSVRATVCILAAVAGAVGAETPGGTNHETSAVRTSVRISSVDSAHGTFKAMTDGKIENFYVTNATKFEEGSISNLKELVGALVKIRYEPDEKTGAGKVLEMKVIREVGEIPPPNPIQVPGGEKSS